MTESLKRFLTRTFDAARALNLGAQMRADLASADLRGGTGESVLQGSHLPLEVVAAAIGPFPVLFGCLPVSPDEALVRDGMRRYRNQAVIARSCLAPEQALDLQLWLLGPDGSEQDPRWRSIASTIERDDRVARKLVWLPPENPEEREDAFNGFIARTFLARPWQTLSPQPAAQLDRLSAVFGVAADLGIEPSVLNRWVELVDSELADGPELVDALVDAWQELMP
jgi:hypothetical protein